MNTYHVVEAVYVLIYLFLMESYEEWQLYLAYFTTEEIEAPRGKTIFPVGKW